MFSSRERGYSFPVTLFFRLQERGGWGGGSHSRERRVAGKEDRRGSGRHGGLGRRERRGQMCVEPDCKLREGRDHVALMFARPDTGPGMADTRCPLTRRKGPASDASVHQAHRSLFPAETAVKVMPVSASFRIFPASSIQIQWLGLFNLVLCYAEHVFNQYASFFYAALSLNFLNKNIVNIQYYISFRRTA